MVFINSIAIPVSYSLDKDVAYSLHKISDIKTEPFAQSKLRETGGRRAPRLNP